MKSPAVESTLDVAEWFYDAALSDREYLQPLKMQRLLFLAQAYYGVANNGRMLLPSIFVADEFGPIDPNVYRIFEQGRPYMEHPPLDTKVKDFLDSIWRRFGSHSGEHLSKVLRGHSPYVDARAQGLRTIIPYEEIIKYYGTPTKAKASRGVPGINQVLRSKVMRSHTGRPVSVRQWMPKAKGEKNE